MRVITLMVASALLLAGCSGGPPSLLSLGVCESEDVDEEDFTGRFHECTDVAGSGAFTIQATCEQGFVGVEFEGGNGTIAMTVVHANGTVWQGEVESNRESFQVFANGTATMRLRSSVDFAAQELAFGFVCFPEEFS